MTPKNGRTAQPQPVENPTYQEIRVETDDGSFVHAYSVHQVSQFGMLLVQETRDDKAVHLYPLNRLKNVKMTPTKLSAV